MPRPMQARHEACQEAAEQGVPVVYRWSCQFLPAYKTKHGHSSGSRESHKALDGQVRPAGEAFQTIWGNALRYPGDPLAPAREVINCHCVLVPDVVGDVNNIHKPSDSMIESVSAASKALVEPYESSFKIYKSVGAKAANCDIVDKPTGMRYHFTEGTRIEDAKTFAGYGGVKPLHEEVLDGLCREFPSSERMKWAHRKGIGYIDVGGEPAKAEVHWFQEEHVGKHKFVIKEWLE